MDPIVLSYEETLLRKSDVDLLRGPHWLNDNIISFYFEFLTNNYKKNPILLFVSPEVTQCIKIIPHSQIKVFLEPLDSKSKQLIFFALNDNDMPQSAGGSHWSLLVYSRAEKTVYHFDSSTGSNADQAEEFAKKLFIYMEEAGFFQETKCLQQRNGHDCGIHLISNAEHLAGFYADTRSSLKNCDMLNQELSNRIITMRQRIIDIIEKLRLSES